MERVIVVRGKFLNPHVIELDEPLTELSGAVEVWIRPIQTEQKQESSEQEKEGTDG